MNRKRYFDYILDKLNTLKEHVCLRGKFNLLDLHVHAENFFLYFFNQLYSWELKNLNTSKQNVEAIDLIDTKRKIVVQVSAANSRIADKISTALQKGSVRDYSKQGYTFKFM